MDDSIRQRDMIRTFSLELVRKCVESVNETGLNSGAMEDKVDVGGLEWHISVLYERESDMVGVRGHNHADTSQTVTLQQVLGLASGLGIDGGDGFDYKMPVSWILSREEILK